MWIFDFWSIYFGRRRLIELHGNAEKIIVDPISGECYRSGVKLMLCNEKCLFPNKAEQIFFCRWQWSKFLIAIAATFFRQKSIIFFRFRSVLCTRFSECKIPKFVKFAAIHYSASNSDPFLAHSYLRSRRNRLVASHVNRKLHVESNHSNYWAKWLSILLCNRLGMRDRSLVQFGPTDFSSSDSVSRCAAWQFSFSRFTLSRNRSEWTDWIQNIKKNILSTGDYFFHSFFCTVKKISNLPTQILICRAYDT